MSMTIGQMREMHGHTIDAITQLVAGAELLIREAEVYQARGGNAAITDLHADYPDDTDEIDRFAALVANVTPIVQQLQAGLMAAGSSERATLMASRGDA